jgi:hypothetical protein
MTTRMRRGTVWLVAAFVVALAVAGTAEARVTGAQASELQRQVDHVLRHSAPGARQIAPNRVTWPRAGVTLTLPVPGTARAAGLADCPKYYACLWQDANYRNRRVQFLHYRTYNLRAYGMPPFTHKGASSYYNHQTDGAKAILHADFDFSMRGHSNLYGSLNDRGRSITLRP